MAKTNHFGALAAAAGALVAVGLLVLMLVLVEARPAGATFPGQNGRIAFSSNRSGPLKAMDIYKMNANGTGLAQLTNNPAEDRAPDWGVRVR